VGSSAIDGSTGSASASALEVHGVRGQEERAVDVEDDEAQTATVAFSADRSDAT
jgi:hypothetical protein